MSDLEVPSRADLIAAVVDSSDVAIVSVNFDGVITSWNRGAENLFGYDQKEAVGQNIALIIPSDHRAEEQAVLDRLRNGQGTEQFETTQQTRQGRHLDISLTVSPIRNANGQLIGASRIARNITEEKHAHENRERLAEIVDSSDDAIVSKTLNGFITSWNRGAERLFGYSETEAVGQHITMIIPPERLAEEDDILARLRRGEKLDHFETIRQTKDGRRLNISLTVSPIRDTRGRVIGASKIARDITERKLLEEERTRAAERVRAALRTADEASRLKDDFLAMVSHELRNPLNSIVGWAGLLRAGKLDDAKIEQAVAAIFRASQVQDQIIGDLLDISRIVSGSMRLDVRPLQLTEVLEEAVTTITPTADAKQIRLQMTLDPFASALAGDASRLRQVFWNLLSNAVKFTARGGQVQVISRRVNSFIEVVVTDTGIGIDPAFLPHIFERFRQADSSASRQSSGLGLGLAIVRHLVELHGGTVWAESKGKGQGSSFSVRLPTTIALGVSSKDDGMRSMTEQVLPADDVPSLHNLKVLVVDDEPAAREIASTVLGQANAEVRLAESANKALEILDQWQPDVIVADIGMPEVDGYEFIRRVRKRSLEQGGAIPAAALTAYARTQDRLRLLSEGYQMHVPKPVQPAELVTVVASLAKRI
jgi:PAS domain S-box-containing protein